MGQNLKEIQIFILRVIGVTLVIISSACGARTAQEVPTVVYATSVPKATAVRVFPTPLAVGGAVGYKGVDVSVSQSEVSAKYINEYGSDRLPPTGRQFVWVQVTLKNKGSGTFALPVPEHYSLLFAGEEFKAGYAYRKDFPDYFQLGSVLYPGQYVKAWLRFDVPADASLSDMQFAFLPESTVVNAQLADTYQWAEHPVFLWSLSK